MAEVKTTGLVTTDVLKQALSAQVVLNVVEAQVRQIISKQIDEEVRVALAGLTATTPGDTGVAGTQEKPAVTENAAAASTAGTGASPEPGTDTSGTEAHSGTATTTGGEATDNGTAGSEGMAEAQPLP
ncbi:TPA: DUF826 domain-containing protein [Escherichia coli]|nr:DUF826 domain-containing protein [Escherichia coli]ELO3213577.1 DUF826 domain-containing protein [Escherichia coli]HAW2729539.1 DUF826 domain-containing protein [Escherichia coli]HCD2258278.1 DUF826 domain-containing protein [Escherichia coli]